MDAVARGQANRGEVNFARQQHGSLQQLMNDMVQLQAGQSPRTSQITQISLSTVQTKTATRCGQSAEKPKNCFWFFGGVTNMALHSSNAPWSAQQQQTQMFSNRGRPVHRLCCAPHSSPSTVNVAAAQQLGLGTRTTASVLWDLDNVCPASPRTSLLPAIQEVKDLLLNMGLHTTPSVTCYANMTTARVLSEQAVACRVAFRDRCHPNSEPTTRVVCLQMMPSRSSWRWLVWCCRKYGPSNRQQTCGSAATQSTWHRRNKQQAVPWS